MSKICRILGALVVTTTVAFSSPYGGLFAGVGLGAGMANNEINYFDIGNGASGKTTANKIGLYYQAHVGYLHEVGDSKTMIGGDIYFNSSSVDKAVHLKADVLGSAGALKAKRSSGYGIAVIAGKLVNPKVMVYTRLGYETSRYNMTLALDGQQDKTFNSNYTGMVPGVGLNYKATSNMLIGVGYDFAGLATKKVIYQDAAQTIELKPVEHRLMVKVSFVFNPF